MTPAEIRRLRQIASKAILEMIKVYENETPKEFQCNETFDFFYTCLLGEIANSFDKWKYEELRELDFTEKEGEEGE